MDAIKNTVNQASESVQGAMSGTSKRGNEEIAKGHTNANATTRLTAAKDAVSDKVDEKKHDVGSSFLPILEDQARADTGLLHRPSRTSMPISRHSLLQTLPTYSFSPESKGHHLRQEMITTADG
ncbi:MAG: hypothetical protein Q9161_001185 [Pseudevernia consocians]